MIAESGHYALVLALALALIQSTVPMLGARLGDGVLMNVRTSHDPIDGLCCVRNEWVAQRRQRTCDLDAFFSCTIRWAAETIRKGGWRWC
jgi:cytochrome c biogenesis factor